MLTHVLKTFYEFFLSWLDFNLWCLVVPITMCIMFCRLSMEIASFLKVYAICYVNTMASTKSVKCFKKMSYLLSSNLVEILTMHLLWWSHLILINGIFWNELKWKQGWIKPKIKAQQSCSAIGVLEWFIDFHFAIFQKVMHIAMHTISHQTPNFRKFKEHSQITKKMSN